MAALPIIDPDVRKFCQNLPKIELHAHVTGSVSDVTLREVLQRHHNVNVLDDHHVWGDMADCFAMFKTLHDVIDNVDDVYTVIHDVIHDFAQDGVHYLELRSTPRHIPHSGMTKRSHIETMIKAIRDCEHLPCITRLLISVDRSQSLESAKEMVDLAIEYQKNTGLVVGIDLSGNPHAGDASQFCHEISRAKNNGLKVSLHLSEVPEKTAETKEMLNMKPDRIGHGTFLHLDGEEIERSVLDQKIPLELCLTSNLKTKSVEAYQDHHFEFWRAHNHPMIICTDDKGVFRTTLTDEYTILMTVFGLDKTQMWSLVMESVEYIFDDERVKEKLRTEFREIRAKSGL